MSQVDDRYLRGSVANDSASLLYWAFAHTRLAKLPGFTLISKIVHLDLLILGKDLFWCVNPKVE